MPHPIQIPRLGWSMEQGTFVGWLKTSGDNVQPGDPLFTLEGEKAIQEIEAVDAGTLHFDDANPAEGDIVAVGAVIGYLLAAGETPPQIPPRQAPSAPTLQNASVLRPSGSGLKQIPPRPLPDGRGTDSFAPPASPAVRRLARQLGVELGPLTSAGRISEADVCRRYLQSRGESLPSVIESNPFTPTSPMPQSSAVPRRGRNLPKISPRAARSASRLGVDWTQLSGTGSQGRIRECDVFAVVDNLVAVPRNTSATIRNIPITPLRRTIAKRMIASQQQTAAVTLTKEIDVSAVVEFREQLKSSGESQVPTFTDVFIKLVATALHEHPLLNARWRDDAIETFNEVHIGIAVDTNDGLLVPVVRDVHRQTIFEVARQTRGLVEKAHARQLTAQDLQGGTFTLSNLGSLGIDAFTPIINYPETAILGLGRIQSRTSIANDESKSHLIKFARPVMTLSLTFDHRVLDGAPAARFLQTLSRLAATDSPLLFEPQRHR